jgi:hypothetical protein
MPVDWPGGLLMPSLGAKSRRRRLAGHTRLAVVLLVAVSSLCIPALASASYDAFDTETLDSLNGGGEEVPYTAAFSKIVEYESQAFTLQEGEQGPPDHTACGYSEHGEARKYYGAKSGWIRFVSAVPGKLSVIVRTPSYAAMAMLYQGQVPRGQKFVGGILTGECNAKEENHALEIETPASSEVKANVPEFIQTLSVCGSLPYATEPLPPESSCTEKGGLTQVTVTFTPSEAPSSMPPLCPGTGVNEPAGCAVTPILSPVTPNTPVTPSAPATAKDSDGDGIADNQDKCPNEYADISISLTGDGRLGCVEPLDASLHYDFGVATNRAAMLHSFSAAAPVGSRLTLSCRGRACPHSLPVALTTTRPLTQLGPLLHRGRLRRGKATWIPVGTTITATATHPGTLGVRMSLIPRSTGSPTHRETCVSPSGKDVECPS